MVSELKRDIVGSTDLAKKRHGSADLHIPIHPPHQGEYHNQMCVVIPASSKKLTLVESLDDRY